MLGNWEIQEPTPKAARTLCSAAWRPWPTRTIRVDGPRTIRVDGPCMRAGHEVEGKVRRPTQIHDPNACLPTSCQWQEAEEATRTVSLRSRNAWRGPKTRSPAERLGKADADQRQVWRARMPVAPRAAAIVLSPLPTCATPQSDSVHRHLSTDLRQAVEQVQDFDLADILLFQWSRQVLVIGLIHIVLFNHCRKWNQGLKVNNGLKLNP